METLYQPIGIKPRIFDANLRANNIDTGYDTIYGQHLHSKQHQAPPPQTPSVPPSHKREIGDDTELEEFYDNETAANPKSKHPCEVESSTIMDFIRANKILISLIIILVIAIAIYFLVFKRESNKAAANTVPKTRPSNKGNKPPLPKRSEDMTGGQSTPQATHDDIVNTAKPDDLRQMLDAAKNKKTLRSNKSSGTTSGNTAREPNTKSSPKPTTSKPAATVTIGLIEMVQQSITGSKPKVETKPSTVKITPVNSEDEGSDADEEESEEESEEEESGSDDDEDEESGSEEGSEEEASEDEGNSAASSDDDQALLRKRAINRLSRSTDDDLAFSDSLSTEERRKLDDKVFAASGKLDDDQISRDLGLLYDQPN